MFCGGASFGTCSSNFKSPFQAGSGYARISSTAWNQSGKRSL